MPQAIPWLSLLSCSGLLLNPVSRGEEHPSTPLPADAVASGEVRITDPLPDGKEEAKPAPPKPRVVFQPEDIVSTRSQDLGGRRIFFQKVTPLELPPIPEPAPRVEITDPEKLALLESAHERHKETKYVFLGAMVYFYDDKPEEARSFVQYWPRPKAKPISLWVKANFLWLSGFAHYETDQHRYSMMLAPSKSVIHRREKSVVRFGREFHAPEIPDFPDDGEASFIIVDGDPTAEELAPIQSLIDLYNSDRQRLRQAFDGRMAAAADRARELEENPPEKKNIILKYWRLDAAGQAGTQPKPAVIR